MDTSDNRGCAKQPGLPTVGRVGLTPVGTPGTHWSLPLGALCHAAVLRPCSQSHCILPYWGHSLRASQQGTAVPFNSSCLFQHHPLAITRHPQEEEFTVCKCGLLWRHRGGKHPRSDDLPFAGGEGQTLLKTAPGARRRVTHYCVKQVKHGGRRVGRESPVAAGRRSPAPSEQK